MVYYARSSRSRKSFGTKRRGYGSNSRRRSYVKTARQTGYRMKTRFATVGYKRDVEKKYHDMIVKYDSTKLNWTASSESGLMHSAAGGLRSDMLKGVPQGVGIGERIGNMIKVRYVKGSISLTANRITNSTVGSENAQNGESAVNANGGDLLQFVRTTYRVAVVRDLQVNSTDPGVAWSQVFYGLAELPTQMELNVATMGRFQVLMDKTVTLDADDPQKVVNFMFRNVGKVRYNGPEGSSPALTDSGLYLVWACHTTGVLDVATANQTFTSPLLLQSRLCFTDA